MKLLLSAYACEPSKGSEPGVGWNWVQALLRRGYDLHVITRSNNRADIESAAGMGGRTAKFAYYDLPAWARFWKKWPGGIYLYYLLWQIGAFRLARQLHAAERFDCVHHITFVSFRQPSFMGFLGIPFIFGPVGGAESMPRALRKGLPISGRVAEAIRNAGNSLIAFDPFMHLTYSRAQLIACTTEETLVRVPKRHRERCIVQRAIGIDGTAFSLGAQSQNSTRRFLFVGRMLYWKGLHLALRAFSEVRRSVPDATLRIIGDGGDREWLIGIARAAGVSDAVEWIRGKPQREIWQQYCESAAFVFPSLHDSGGMVVLEALSAGLPVICLDLGGPGSIVDDSCGIAVRTGGKDERAVIRSLAEAMVKVCLDSDYRAQLSTHAPERAAEMTWDAAADAIYSSNLLTSVVTNARQLQAVDR
jgi:glycosyltransferase involved in cell wall biosynthesis